MSRQAARLVGLALVVAAGAGCTLVPRPGPEWTVRRAIDAIRAIETDEPLRIEEIVAAPLVYNEHMMTDFRLAVMGPLESQPGDEVYIRFRDVTGVTLAFDPMGIVLMILTFGLEGPFWYDLEVATSDHGVREPYWANDSNNFLWNILPLWLLGARYWGSSELWEYAEAVEVLRRHSQLGDPAP